MKQQLILPIQLPTAATLANYVVGSNSTAFTSLLQSLSGEEKTPLFLYGEKGVGKTHLLQACCHAAKQQQLNAMYLPMHYHAQLTPSVLEGLEQLDILCVDDVQALVKIPAWEEALFHCYNRLLPTKTRLIVAALARPHDLAFQLADLVSRLQACLIFQLKPLSDAEKMQVLQQQAQERGFEIQEEVAQYLLNHTQRDLPHLLAWIDRLDQLSLSTQRKITLPLLRECLTQNTLVPE